MPRAADFAYLTLRVTFPVGDAEEALPEDVLDYHRRIETDFSRLSRLKHVEEEVASAMDWEKDGKTFWTEEFSLQIENVERVETVAEKIVKLVRKAGIRSGHQFELEKQIVQPDDHREVFTKRIYPVRKARWVLQQTDNTLKPAAKSRTPYPKHLEYLAEMAGRCDGVGGNDVYVLFREDSELEQFLKGLSAEDRQELIAIYQKIVRHKHNEWFLKWLKDHAEELDRPKWVNELAWFLSLLDRLREGGLLKSTRGKAKRTVLLFWGDDLCGEPYTED